MAYRYPDLARFMAGHWATSAVHIVPVFGERGALLEHAVFDLFYNYPLTIQRRIQRRLEARSQLKARYWHVPLCALAGSALLALSDWGYFQWKGHIPTFGETWWFMILLPVLTAIWITSRARGAPLSRRILMGGLSGALTGLFYAILNSAFSVILSAEAERFAFPQILGQIAPSALWKMFLFTLLAVMAVFIFEARPVKKAA
jgi:hypothetical protein